MGQGLEPLPSQVGEIHLGMALERVLTCLGNVLFDEFPFVGGTTCIRQRLDPARSLFEASPTVFPKSGCFGDLGERGHGSAGLVHRAIRPARGPP